MIVHPAPGEELSVATIDELDHYLDQVESDLTGPTLLRLSGTRATLHIGLGHPDHAVALYRDEHGQSWSSHRSGSAADELAFAKNGHRFEFNPTAAITVAQARHAAREFATTDEKPTNIGWAPEPA